MLRDGAIAISGGSRMFLSNSMTSKSASRACSFRFPELIIVLPTTHRSPTLSRRKHAKNRFRISKYSSKLYESNSTLAFRSFTLALMASLS